MAGISHVSGAGFDTDVPVLPTAGVASDGTTPVAHITGDEISRAASSKLTLLSDVDLHVSAGDSIAGMSVADKVATTARAGIAIAAKDAGGAVGTFLKDPKNDAMLLGGTAALAGVQAIPGLDAGVDATLGVVGVAMYASAGPSHRANVTTALGKLKDYAGEVGGAKTQADLDKASKDFANFLKIGGKEAADALGVVAGAASAPTKFFGLAEKAKALGGIDGVIAAQSTGVKGFGEKVRAAEADARDAFSSLDGWLTSAARQAGLGGDPAFALPGGASIRDSAADRASGILEARAHDPNAAARRTVDQHEVSGGHTVDVHVGKSDIWLQNRLKTDPGIDAASTFTSEAAANRAQGTFVKHNRAQIDSWLANPEHPRIMKSTFDTGKPVGRVLEKGEATPVSTTKAYFMLERDSSPHGWHFQTSYPVK